MKYFCDSGKHLLFDSEAQHSCGTCADLERLIANQRVMPMELKLCQKHKTDVQSRCLSRRIALDWNTSRRYCIRCGEPAIGYRALSKDKPVEFFCDEHFEGVPEAQNSLA